MPSGALGILTAVEAHRFRLGLLPGWAYVADPPPPELPPLGPGRTSLCAVCIEGAVSVVEIEPPLYAVLSSVSGARTREAIVDEAALRLGGDRGAAEAALASLVEDELLVATS